MVTLSLNKGKYMRIYENILQTIGRTPLVKVGKLNDSNATILAKLEFFNPGGSVKDRIGASMITAAELEHRHRACYGGCRKGLPVDLDDAGNDEPGAP